MATIGNDAMIILDGTGYMVKPESYKVHQPRLSKSSYRADGTLSWTDIGAGKRTWTMTILCVNELKKYDSTTISTTGQAFRDALRSSYTSNIATTITYKDPQNTSISVYFTDYHEAILDMKSQIIAFSTGGSLAASYEVSISLLEA